MSDNYELEQIRQRILERYRSDPKIRINVSIAQPKLHLSNVPVEITGVYLISFKLKKTPPGRQSGIRCHIRMCWHIILRFWIPEIVQESIRPAVKQEGCPLTKTYYSAQSTGYSWWILALYECAIIKSQLFPLKQLAFCNFKVAFAHRIHQLTVVSWISSLSLLNQRFSGFYFFQISCGKRLDN